MTRTQQKNPIGLLSPRETVCSDSETVDVCRDEAERNMDGQGMRKQYFLASSNEVLCFIPNFKEKNIKTKSSVYPKTYRLKIKITHARPTSFLCSGQQK